MYYIAKVMDFILENTICMLLFINSLYYCSLSLTKKNKQILCV